MTSLRCDLRVLERTSECYVASAIPKRCAVIAHKLYWDCLSIPMAFPLGLKCTPGIHLKGPLLLTSLNACAKNSKYDALFSWPTVDFSLRKIWSIFVLTVGTKNMVNLLSG